MSFTSAITAQISSMMSVFLLMSCQRHPSPTCSFIPLDHSYYQLLSHIPAPTSFREFSEVVVKYKERHLEMKPLEFLAAASILCTCLQTAASK
ncbi:Os04g0436900 [Oryza sativa Japonica Group]|uniref:Os04g0436900 protein n=3 Tax=Oryza TaxID=4527 RepID=Q0JD18_ORYSJ|nr:Os04g0436900 [Oryza sativa Japonica Group]BAS89312.1 Os04g0436900 [Oryza sativa Japonica Group]|eukprot:NP_001052855.1 Os04g0436900 [Oryza sativa Japonica Group]